MSLLAPITCICLIDEVFHWCFAELPQEDEFQLVPPTSYSARLFFFFCLYLWAAVLGGLRFVFLPSSSPVVERTGAGAPQ